MTNPLLSVALPVYNGAEYLSLALDSILAQSYSDFELIVSDNCSSDATPLILAEYQAKDSRIKVSRSEVFLPQADNTNRVLELCNGKWVKLFCHDDLMDENCLSVVSKVITAKEIASVGLIGNGQALLFSNGYQDQHNAIQESQRSSALSEIWVGRTLARRLIVGGAPVGLPGLTQATVRKEAWQTSPHFNNRYIHFDTFLWYQILMHWNYKYIPDILTINRIHGHQVTVSARKSLKSIEDHTQFWKTYTDAYGTYLNLDYNLKLKIKLKPISKAASIIAIEILKGNYYQVADILRHIPKTWLAIIPALTIRFLRAERGRLYRLRKSVPINMIYPG